MITLQSIAQSIALTIVCIGCVLHLIDRVDWRSLLCERLGFVFAGAGAFGEVIYLWWPKVELFPFSLLMHVGMALIALSLFRVRAIEMVKLAFDDYRAARKETLEVNK